MKSGQKVDFAKKQKKRETKIIVHKMNESFVCLNGANEKAMKIIRNYLIWKVIYWMRE